MKRTVLFWVIALAVPPVSGGQAVPPAGRYPVTEARAVQRPGQYHFVRTIHGDYVLTDIWLEEHPVGEREYDGQAPWRAAPARRAMPDIWLELPASDGVPATSGEVVRGRRGVGRGTLRYDEGRLTTYQDAILVEIVSGKRRGEDGTTSIRPASFYIYEGETRAVRVQLRDDSFVELTASFDGFGVDLGAAQVARADAEHDGQPQQLGDSPLLEDLEVVVSLGSRHDGGEKAPAEGAETGSDSRDSRRVIRRNILRYSE